jgi:HD-GYP domain-containing protein (c-di-GMP phosphodiesterase class II)
MEAQKGVVVGGEESASDSARSTFIPVPLKQTACEAFSGIAVYLRNEKSKAKEKVFTLYRSAELEFEEEDRTRLLKAAVKHVFVRIADHAKFRRQAEASLLASLNDTSKSLSARCSLVYEISSALIDEVLSDPDLGQHAERMTSVARSVAKLVLENKGAFDQLFVVSNHDLYTGTHLVNVGTFMVPLAYALGYKDSEELSIICQAGMLHDIGKIFVPTEVLNKGGQLSDAEWECIRNHPVAGHEHMETFENTPEIVRTVCLQHHEREDGSGYPSRLRGSQIHPVSKMCAVVDSFDAMTAIRPFRQKAKSLSEAIMALRTEAGNRYDTTIVEAFLGLLNDVSDRDLKHEDDEVVAGAPAGRDRRRHKRFACNIPAELHLVSKDDKDQWRPEGKSFSVTTRDASRFGMGLLSPRPLPKGQTICVHMKPEGGKGKRFYGRVAWCGAGEHGAYSIGLNLFVQPDTKSSKDEN